MMINFILHVLYHKSKKNFKSVIMRKTENAEYWWRHEATENYWENKLAPLLWKTAKQFLSWTNAQTPWFYKHAIESGIQIHQKTRNSPKLETIQMCPLSVKWVNKLWCSFQQWEWMYYRHSNTMDESLKYNANWKNSHKRITFDSTRHETPLPYKSMVLQVRIVAVLGVEWWPGGGHQEELSGVENLLLFYLSSE